MSNWSIVCGVVTCWLCLPTTLLALNPYEPDYTPPVDSIVVWFNDACNQHQQVRAFWHISKNSNLATPPLQMVEIEPAFNLPVVKTAFVNFVNYLSINRNARNNCSSFLADVNLGELNPNGMPNDPQAEFLNTDAILPYILSLYMNLGYTQNLFQIADSLWRGGDGIYWNFLHTQLGSAYFSHLKSETALKPDILIGIDVANNYLRLNRYPDPAIRTLSIQILEQVALTGSTHQKLNATRYYLDLYSQGYTELRDEIEALIASTNQTVSQNMIYEIQWRQKNRGELKGLLIN